MDNKIVINDCGWQIMKFSKFAKTWNLLTAVINPEKEFTEFVDKHADVHERLTSLTALLKNKMGNALIITTCFIFMASNFHNDSYAVKNNKFSILK